MAKLRIEAKSRTPRLCVNHESRGQELTRGGHNHRKGRKLDCQQKYGERRTKKREEEDGGREEERREARDSGCLRVCASAAVQRTHAKPGCGTISSVSIPEKSQQDLTAHFISEELSG